MTMDRRRSTVTLFSLCLAAFVVGLLDAQRPPRNYWSPENYPNPQSESDLDLCGLGDQKGLVCDPNRKLNPYEANVSNSGIIAVRDALRHIREETRCPCSENATQSGLHCDQYDVRGYTVAVALADYMDVQQEYINNDTYLEEKAREFAITLRELWRFGQCNDDVIIFVSTGDKKIWTAVGTVAGAVLTPALIQSVSRRAKLLLDEREYTKALLQMIGEYKRALKGEEVAIDKDEPHLPLGMPLWLLIVLAVLIVLVLLGLVALIIRCFCTSKRSDDYTVGRQTS